MKLYAIQGKTVSGYYLGYKHSCCYWAVRLTSELLYATLDTAYECIEAYRNEARLQGRTSNEEFNIIVYEIKLLDILTTGPNEYHI